MKFMKQVVDRRTRFRHVLRDCWQLDCKELSFLDCNCLGFRPSES